MRRLVVLVAVVSIVAASAADTAGRGLKGNGPTSIAVGFGSVWVGFASGDTVRIRVDPASGHEQARFRGNGFVQGLSVAAGGVWVVGAGLTRIDPATDSARDITGLAGARLVEGSARGGAVWVVDGGSNTVLGIAMRTMKVSVRARVPGRAWGVAAGMGRVLVLSVPRSGPVTGPAGPRLLQWLDRSSGRLSTVRARLRCDAGVAVGLGAAWTLDACTGSLSRRDVRTLRVERQRSFGVLSQTPALGFGSVWLAGRGGVRRIDPRTLRTVAVIPAWCLQVVVGDAAVWAFDPAHRLLRKIDPNTNRLAGRPIVVPRDA